MDKRFIYGLYDPRKPDMVMVVGKTKVSLKYRLSIYISTNRRLLKLGQNLCSSQKWILSLLIKGIRPGIKLLATTDVRNWRKVEKRFITAWRKKNSNLCNVRDGGDGSDAGKFNIHCGKCGTEKRQYAGGQWFCPSCTLTNSRSPRRRASQRAYRRLPSTKRRYRKWLRSPRGKAKGSAYTKKWRKSVKGRTYQRNYMHNYYIRHRALLKNLS